MSVILMVDNESDLVEIYKRTFEDAGHSFITTNNINKAFKMCRGGGINLVISNMLLPIDPKTNKSLGFILLKSIKMLPSTKHIPAIILSNLSTVDKQKKASQLGADAFLVKSSYTPKQVLNKVEKYLK